MSHIIYICIIAFLIFAYIGRYRAYERLDERCEEFEAGMDYHHNRSEHWRLMYEAEQKKDSVEAYNALEQGLTETQDAYVTDLAQYEDSLMYELRDVLNSIRHRFTTPEAFEVPAPLSDDRHADLD